MPAPTCPKCFSRKVRDKGYGRYEKTCYPCAGKKYPPGTKERLRLRYRYVIEEYRNADGKVCCTRCGFVSVDDCQIDVNHIDGNTTNNARENLEVVCACCHRLISKLSGHPKTQYWGYDPKKNV